MNPTADNSLPEPETVTVEGPGIDLSRARLEQGLDLEEVSRKLRLSVKLIDALERDDYTDLPGSTYVRGYLRAYAGMLGIPPEPVLEAHARLNAGKAPASLGKLAVTEQVTSQHRHMRLTTYLVIAVIFGLSIAWWQARDVRRGGADPAVSATPAPAEEMAESPTPGAPGPAPGSAATPLASPSVPTVAPRPATAPPRVVPEAGRLANLTVHAEQESWADIRDAEDRRLVYEVLPAGRTVTLQGIPPFSVYLGNVAGVRVELNGAAQDLERYGPGPVARFRIGDRVRSATPRTVP